MAMVQKAESVVCVFLAVLVLYGVILLWMSMVPQYHKYTTQAGISALFVIGLSICCASCRMKSA